MEPVSAIVVLDSFVLVWAHDILQLNEDSHEVERAVKGHLTSLKLQPLS